MTSNTSYSGDSMPNILLIDDEYFIHELVSEALSDCCCVISVESGEDAIMATNMWKPDLILVDVAMPGKDGYETCRYFKDNDSTTHIPILFLSAHEEIEDKLKGYEAGGDDYLVKPFNLLELKAKVLHLLEWFNGRDQLQSQVDFASSTAMTAMTSMSEMGSLLHSLQKFNSREDMPSLAQAVIDGVHAFDLHGVVRIKGPKKAITLSDHGPASPIEESVMDNMADMERIVHFKSRMSIHYDHVSLLISNMPTDDDARCGRLRDHLAMMVEAADSRARGIISMQESSLRGSAIASTVAKITDALKEIDNDQRNSQLSASLALNKMIDNVEKALLSVALTEKQDAYLSEVIRVGIEEIMQPHASGIDLQNKLTLIIRELKDTLPDC